MEKNDISANSAEDMMMKSTGDIEQHSETDRSVIKYQIKDDGTLKCLRIDLKTFVGEENEESDVGELDDNVTDSVDSDSDIEQDDGGGVKGGNKSNQPIAKINVKSGDSGDISNRKFNCTECDMIFETVAERRCHKFKVHRIPCEHCDKTFPTKYQHKKHNKDVHEREKNYECPDCNKAFSRSSTLKNHIYALHTDAKDKTKYECGVCEKVFYQKSKLELHMSLHTGEKKFKCTYEDCQKVFRLQSNLKKHLDVHAQRRPFECEECGARFSRNSYLEAHMYKHSGEKLYQCDICESRFSTKGNLTTHRKMHNSDIPVWACVDCGCSFKYKSNYTKHIRKKCRDSCNAGRRKRQRLMADKATVAYDFMDLNNEDDIKRKMVDTDDVDADDDADDDDDDSKPIPLTIDTFKVLKHMDSKQKPNIFEVKSLTRDKTGDHPYSTSTICSRTIPLSKNTTQKNTSEPSGRISIKPTSLQGSRNRTISLTLPGPNNSKVSGTNETVVVMKTPVNYSHLPINPSNSKVESHVIKKIESSENISLKNRNSVNLDSKMCITRKQPVNIKKSEYIHREMTSQNTNSINITYPKPTIHGLSKTSSTIPVLPQNPTVLHGSPNIPTVLTRVPQNQRVLLGPFNNSTLISGLAQNQKVLPVVSQNPIVLTRVPQNQRVSSEVPQNPAVLTRLPQNRTVLTGVTPNPVVLPVVTPNQSGLSGLSPNPTVFKGITQNQTVYLKDNKLIFVNIYRKKGSETINPPNIQNSIYSANGNSLHVRNIQNAPTVVNPQVNSMICEENLDELEDQTKYIEDNADKDTVVGLDSELDDDGKTDAEVEFKQSVENSINKKTENLVNISDIQDKNLVNISDIQDGTIEPAESSSSQVDSILMETIFKDCGQRGKSPKLETDHNDAYIFTEEDVKILLQESGEPFSDQTSAINDRLTMVNDQARKFHEHALPFNDYNSTINTSNRATTFNNQVSTFDKQDRTINDQSATFNDQTISVNSPADKGQQKFGSFVDVSEFVLTTDS